MKLELDHISLRTEQLIQERQWSAERLLQLAIDFINQQKTVRDFEAFLSCEALSEVEAEVDAPDPGFL
ncbi:MAG: hypothetical protein KC657_17500 [Myxococcales bacterium]|nr:hypothetical protein [Myxococcales bacterium]MCB0360647.1 hypothetical protein [Bdellovibrionales bacterium]